MRSRYGVSPPRWKPQPAPRIMQRSICCGVATTPSSSMCPTSTVRRGEHAVEHAGLVERPVPARARRTPPGWRGRPAWAAPWPSRAGPRVVPSATSFSRPGERGNRSPSSSRSDVSTCRPTAGPTRSNSSNGGIGRPSGRSARSATSTGVPFSTASTITPSSRTSSRLTTKPGTVRDEDGRLAQLGRDGEPGGQRLERRALGLHDLDQRHRGHGVEEVQPDDALGVLQVGRHRGDRQRGGVRREDRRRGDDGLQLGEHLLLQVEDLGDRLDDEVAGRELGEVGGAVDRAEQPARGRLAHPARRREAVDGRPHRGEALVDALLVEVAHDDRDAEALREQHRDLRGHEPGADDADPGDGLRERPVGGADGLLAAGHEPERVHRRAHLVAHDQVGERLVLGRERLLAGRGARGGDQVERAVRRRAASG